MTRAAEEAKRTEAHEAGATLVWTPADIAKWMGAITRWIAAGQPVRTERCPKDKW